MSGKDLRQRAVLAVLAATVVMGVYIAMRFEPRFGIGAAVALLHDVMVAVGALSFMPAWSSTSPSSRRC